MKKNIAEYIIIDLTIFKKPIGIIELFQVNENNILK